MDDAGLLFSDIHANTIYLWSLADSAVTVFLRPSDSSNGLTFDAQRRLVLTQMAKRRVSRRETNGTITPLASSYNGKKFNSPNDLVVRADGSVFFTDPDFNTPKGQAVELPYRGVYRISPAGSLRLIDSTFAKPNGICFSPDEKKLYVNESPEGKIYSWDVVNDSTFTGKKLLYDIPTSGYADGMKTDAAGNIYCTGPGGVWIVSPAGFNIGKIATPETPTNCGWGGKDRKTLFITAGTSLYRIRMSTTGVNDYGALSTGSFRLHANYPNPFNPSTTIEYELERGGTVELNVFNSLGQRVSTIVDGYRQAGSHSVTFEPHDLASGVYVYRLSTGSSADAKKMLLTR